MSKRPKRKQEAKLRQKTIDTARVDMTMFLLVLIFWLVLSGMFAAIVCYLF